MRDPHRTGWHTNGDAILANSAAAARPAGSLTAAAGYAAVGIVNSGWRNSPGETVVTETGRSTVATCCASTHPPVDLDPVSLLEEHLALGWEYDVEVVIDAPVDSVARCLPRAFGRLEPLDAETACLIGSTSNPVWHAEQLATIPTSYRIVLQEAAGVLGQRLLAAVPRG